MDTIKYSRGNPTIPEPPRYVAIALSELTSLQQQLAIANSELDRVMADNARYLRTLRSLATWANDAIDGKAEQTQTKYQAKFRGEYIHD